VEETRANYERQNQIAAGYFASLEQLGQLSIAASIARLQAVAGTRLSIQTRQAAVVQMHARLGHEAAVTSLRPAGR
jgi:hypothetical protein